MSLKTQLFIIRNIFISMKSYKRESVVWERNSRIEYETDVIRGEFRFNNSKQEFSIFLAL
jgi:Fe-S cluster assembly iron-binding protein IscA